MSGKEFHFMRHSERKINFDQCTNVRGSIASIRWPLCNRLVAIKQGLHMFRVMKKVGFKKSVDCIIAFRR